VSLREFDRGDGVRANAREMYTLVEAAVRRTVTQVSRAELLRSLRDKASSRVQVSLCEGEERR
jgi:hypothetical protein